MAFLPIILTFTTCINSGLPGDPRYNLVNSIRDTSNQIVEEFSESTDFSNYNLTFEQSQSVAVQRVFEFAKEKQLLSPADIFLINRAITLSPNYYEVEDINSLFLKEGIDSDVFHSNLMDLGDDFLDDISSLVQLEEPSIDGNIRTLGFEPGIEDDDKELLPEPPYMLPRKSYDGLDTSISLTGEVDGYDFFGIICSPGACICVYDIFAEMVNQINDENSLYNTVRNIFKQLSLIAPTTAAAVLYANVTNLLTQLINTIRGIIDPIVAALVNHPIGVIIYAAICLIIAAVIFVLGMMFVAGCFGKGAYFGFKIRGFLYIQPALGFMD